jgi:hypothetical protein
MGLPRSKMLTSGFPFVAPDCMLMFNEMYPECCIVYIVVGISRIVKEEWPGPL